MRVLVTGITGFVGGHLGAHLTAAGHEVFGTTWEGDPAAPEHVGLSPDHLLSVDVADREAVEAAIEEVRPEGVVHLAGLSHVGGSWSRMGEYFQVNVAGTDHLVTALGKHAPGARLLLASSAEVYGAVPEAEQPLEEERRLLPGSPYALTKAAAERLVLAGAARGLVPVVVRSFNLIGPGQSARFALASFAAQLAAIERGESEAVLRVGNLSARRDFLHVADAARAYGLLLAAGESGLVVNLASGRARSIAELLEGLMEVAGVRPAIVRDPERFRPVDQPLLCGDPGRLATLGWTEELGVDRALEEIWQEARARAVPQGG